MMYDVLDGVSIKVTIRPGFFRTVPILETCPGENHSFPGMPICPIIDLVSRICPDLPISAAVCYTSMAKN